ncbi:MAG: aminotransferase class III-fold pyridoxal phosphate-dependent enzyme [Candidatus Eisenbacteria bacterium]|nr:aminotransferase class III-fold pyridoxal phosphate-dependent enzyme [Candidatus Eisenbacteria bacterium]
MSRVFGYPGHELLVEDIVRAEDCYLYDARGKRYVDLESGVWCTSVGHGNGRVRRVMAEQAEKLTHAGFCWTSPIVKEAAEEALALVGMEGGAAVFLCSGSEAIEYGMRVAQAIAGPGAVFLTLADSYFGAYGSAQARRVDEWVTLDWLGCATCREQPDRCEHWGALPWDRIAGFLFEPGSSSGLVRFPPAPLVERIVAEVRSRGGLVMVNEVTTGVGRTGRWFGYQHYGIAPDVVAIGKGIGNGYPVSIATFARAVAERLEEKLGSEPIRYAQSHQNDPLGAAVAREVIRIVRDERLVERAERLGRTFAAGLEGVKERTGRIAEIRARGLMIGVELAGDDGLARITRVHRELVRRGYVVGRRPGVNVLRIDPPLTVAEADLDGFAGTLEEVLREAR